MSARSNGYAFQEYGCSRAIAFSLYLVANILRFISDQIYTNASRYSPFNGPKQIVQEIQEVVQVTCYIEGCPADTEEAFYIFFP